MYILMWAENTIPQRQPEAANLFLSPHSAFPSRPQEVEMPFYHSSPNLWPQGKPQLGSIRRDQICAIHWRDSRHNQWQQNLDVMQSHDVSAGAKLLGLLLYKTVAMSGVVCLIIASKCSLPWGGGLGRCSDTHVCLGCLWIPSTRWVWNVASHFCP